METSYKLTLFIFLSLFKASDTSINLSSGRNTTQSSVYNDIWIAANVVDECIKQFINSGCCLHTAATGQLEAWWQVDLETLVVIETVHIYYRDEGQQKQRFGGFEIHISNGTDWRLGHQCYKDTTPNQASLSLTPRVNCTGITQYLTVYSDRQTRPHSWYSTWAILELCEVEVYGCVIGRFGENNCDKTCPKRCENDLCHPETGECFNCTDGYFKMDKTCVPCPSNCLSTCDKTSGACLGCKSSFYGISCDKDCSVNCMGNKCSQQDGHCYGCIDGKFGTVCSENCNGTCGVCLQQDGECTACIDGYYGQSCMNKCGHCSPTFCDKTNGTCTCQNGWEGEKCDIQSEMTTGGNTGVYAGVVVGCLVVIIIIAVLVVLIVRRRHLSGITHKTQLDDNVYYNGDVAKQHVPKKGQVTSNSNNDDDRKQVYVNIDVENKRGEERIYNNENISPYSLSIEEVKAMIPVKKEKDNEMFQAEFKKFPWGAVHPHEAGKKVSNKSKNRFKTTFPYDHSRIVLDTMETGSDSDYINANYIDSTDTNKVYVASQGPKPNTLDDFWRMIWQLNTSKIVMLTNLIESGNVKCHKYWPEDGEPLSTQHFNLTLDRERSYAFYVLRDMSIVHKKTKVERQVHQFHFTTWPDHGTPDTLELVLFHRRVISFKTQSTGQMVIHCSAGLGRTGTFIGLDALLEKLKTTGTVDIQSYVQIMRKDRMNMIQTCEQYVALHELIVEAFDLQETLVSNTDFPSVMQTCNSVERPTNQTKIRTEFEALQLLKPKYEPNLHSAALMKENRNKNRTMSVLAGDNFRVFLRSQLPGRTDYINAVLLQSYTSRSGYLVTQFPLDDTIDDFWSMVRDYHCDSVVVLGRLDEKWLHNQNESNSKRGFHLIKQQESTLIPGVISVDYFLTGQKSSSKSSVRVYTIPDWSSDKMVPPSDTSFLQLLEQLDRRRRSNNAKPVVVMCLNGCTQSGLFCCVSNARDQMELDGEVDIFQAARQVLRRRPEAIQNFEQYNYCYNIIAKYLESTHVYIN